MRQRFIAVAVVVGSACTALHFSQTEQHAIHISNNPYTYPGTGMSASFTVTPFSLSDDDQLQTVALGANCSSQWTLMLNPTDTLPTRICNGAMPSAVDMSDGNGVQLCPHSYTFGVYFAGNQPGTIMCDVELTWVPTQGGSADTYILKLTGTGSGSSGISVSPPSIDFGDVQINTTSSSSPVTVKNNGSAFVTVNGSISGPPFGVTPSPASFGLGPGSSANFNVTCMPGTTGDHMGSIEFSSGASMGSSALTCTGINSMVNISPSQVTFDPTLVGRMPPNRTVMITSTNGATTIDSVTLDTDATNAGVTIVTNPQGMQIGGGKNVVLAYSAAAMHASGPLGVLTIDTSLEAPRNVPISGEALLGGVGTNPNSIDFGPVCAGDTATEDVEVYASEPGSIVLQSITPLAAGPFMAMSLDTLPKTLAGNHAGPSANIRVTVAPTMPGELMGTLVLTTDVPQRPTTELDITATALAGGISATPNAVSFGNADVGATTSVKQVELTNCGTTDLMFDRANISGTNATEFTLIGENASKTLAPTESEVFLIVMQPRSAGLKSATLNIHHSAGTTTADLDGTATGGEEKERETYYACSTGRGAGWWPIVFALLALRRRRR